MIVDGLLYTEEHEWVRIKDNIAIIGITDYAQQQLGEITFVEVPETGTKLQQNDELGVVESSKAASDVYSPVAGKVTEVNTELQTKPELINDACYDAGWICKVEISDVNSTKNLMDSKQYEEYLKKV